MTPDERPVLTPEQERISRIESQCSLRPTVFSDDVRFLLRALAAKDAEIARVTKERDAAVAVQESMAWAEKANRLELHEAQSVVTSLRAQLAEAREAGR